MTQKYEVTLEENSPYGTFVLVNVNATETATGKVTARMKRKYDKEVKQVK